MDSWVLGVDELLIGISSNFFSQSWRRALLAYQCYDCIFSQKIQKVRNYFSVGYLNLFHELTD